MSMLRPILSTPPQPDAVEMEFAQDIWDARRLPGVRYPACRSIHLLNFTRVPTPFRSSTKRYVRFQLVSHSLSDCRRRLWYIQLFADFFTALHPAATTLRELRRTEIEQYLLYLQGRKGTLNHRGQQIGDESVWRGLKILRDFLEYLVRTDSPEAPLLPVEKLIWPSDGGARPRQIPTRSNIFLSLFCFNWSSICITCRQPIFLSLCCFVLQAGVYLMC